MIAWPVLYAGKRVSRSPASLHVPPVDLRNGERSETVERGEADKDDRLVCRVQYRKEEMKRWTNLSDL